MRRLRSRDGVQHQIFPSLLATNTAATARASYPPSICQDLDFCSFPDTGWVVIGEPEPRRFPQEARINRALFHSKPGERGGGGGGSRLEDPLPLVCNSGPAFSHNSPVFREASSILSRCWLRDGSGGNLNLEAAAAAAPVLRTAGCTWRRLGRLGGR